jgi:predicted RNase H-like HicB family nuclease
MRWYRSSLGPFDAKEVSALLRYNKAVVEIQPIRVDLEREDEGRILASVPDLPGVMAYGVSEEEAVRKVKSTALQVPADMID